MRVCRKVQRLCQSTGSSKPSVVANAATLGQLMDISLRVHKNYEQMGVLSPGNRRLKARLFLHFQHVCVISKFDGAPAAHKVIHTNCRMLYQLKLNARAEAAASGENYAPVDRCTPIGVAESVCCCQHSRSRTDSNSLDFVAKTDITSWSR